MCVSVYMCVCVHVCVCVSVCACVCVSLYVVREGEEGREGWQSGLSREKTSHEIL